MSELKQNVSLKEYNSFGFDVFADTYFAFSSADELREGLKLTFPPYLVLGGGSNLCLTDDVKTTVLHNRIKGIEIISEKNDSIVVRVGAGEVWHDFVLWAIAHDYGGIENLSLIPGTVGAAPIQNIGAYGVEIKDVFVSLQALDLRTGEVVTFSREDCQFGYRDSIFKGNSKGKYIITTVDIILTRPPHTLHTSYGAISNRLETMGVSEPSIADISQAVIAIRSSKLPDPANIGNAGSFFKNPVIDRMHYERLKAQYPDIVAFMQADGLVKVPAGWLIEKAGWKGKRRGQVGCHKDQSLVLVNYGGGSGADIQTLAQDIKTDIHHKYGIMLQEEVNII